MYITIGRNPQSDIVISGCNVVSFDHATIEYQNGRFLFIDDSTNGTVINGIRINHESRPIVQGDRITLAGAYNLDWNTILSKVPGYTYCDRPTVSHISHETELMPHNANNVFDKGVVGQGSPEKPQQENVPQTSEPPILDRWNWGAFWLGWLWGVFNNVYWTLVALIPIPLCGLIVNIIAGIKGTRQAWENGNWKEQDYETFKSKQHRWAVAGFIVFGISILLTILYAILLVTVFNVGY